MDILTDFINKLRQCIFHHNKYEKNPATSTTTKELESENKAEEICADKEVYSMKTEHIQKHFQHLEYCCSLQLHSVR